MGSMDFLSAAIESRLMDLHCAYIGKVVSVSGDTATVQPLGLVKDSDSAAKKQAVVSNVPIACNYKFSIKTISYTTSDGDKASQTVAVPSRIAAGDLVVCLCADRSITAARRGRNEQPTAGHHSISDSIIVGIL